MLYPSQVVPAIADRYVNRHVHLKNPRPLRFVTGEILSAYERRNVC